MPAPKTESSARGTRTTTATHYEVFPAALSDHSCSDAEEVPAKGTGKGKQPVQEDAVDDEGDSDIAEDEYVVEAIHGHRFLKGVLQFDVKWEGYDDPKDRTWETEENMQGAIDVMKEYFSKIGGRPEPKGQKRKGRPSVAGPKSASGTPAASSKRAKSGKAQQAERAWSPPPGSWEHDVSHIDTVEETRDPKTGELGKFAYLVWLNQQKTQHPLKHVYQKCPQKMLQYYESHLVFTHTGDDDSNDIMMKDY
ncbi:chromo domain-containing protein [Stemphylium lycopersici]|nr:chromo domain-containing protein [Stemphylium lycopersici]